MKFENMPAIFALSAALVVSVSTFFSGMDTVKSLTWILVSLLVFYIIGIAFKALFNVILSDESIDEKEVISEEEDFFGQDDYDVEKNE